MKKLLLFLPCLFLAWQASIAAPKITVITCEDFESNRPELAPLQEHTANYLIAWSMMTPEASTRALLSGSYFDTEDRLTELCDVHLNVSSKQLPALLQEAAAKPQAVIILTSLGQGGNTDKALRVPFVVYAPDLIAQPYRTRDLVDLTDIVPTVLALQGKTSSKPSLSGKSIVPALMGDEDALKKRSYIYTFQGDLQLIRDWHHLIDNKEGFWAIAIDPDQEHEVRANDKIAPHREKRLKMLLEKLSKTR